MKKVRLNVQIEADLYKAFKLKCVESDKTISEVVTSLVQAVVEDRVYYKVAEELKPSGSPAEEKVLIEVHSVVDSKVGGKVDSGVTSKVDSPADSKVGVLAVEEKTPSWVVSDLTQSESDVITMEEKEERDLRMIEELFDRMEHKRTK